MHFRKGNTIFRKGTQIVVSPLPSTLPESRFLSSWMKRAGVYVEGIQGTWGWQSKTVKCQPISMSLVSTQWLTECSALNKGISILNLGAPRIWLQNSFLGARELITSWNAEGMTDTPVSMSYLEKSFWTRWEAIKTMTRSCMKLMENLLRKSSNYWLIPKPVRGQSLGGRKAIAMILL